MKSKYLAACVTTLLAVLFFVFASAERETKSFENPATEIVLRKIGHEILLRSGDDSSRVLPVVREAQNQYGLRFESSFHFSTDSLVTIINRTMAAHHLPSSYIVRVTECFRNQMVYGFIMSGPGSDNIVPCTGRTQPEGCYAVHLQFQPPATTRSIEGWQIVGLCMLGAGLLFWGSRLLTQRKTRAGWGKQKEETLPAAENEGIRIGLFTFFKAEQYLSLADKKIHLTAKESRLLHIFATAPGEVIGRRRLQKEVWEDEGVIVSRSLDMFISRLRKKLEADPSVHLVNIHGKGYKLELKGY